MLTSLLYVWTVVFQVLGWWWGTFRTPGCLESVLNNFLKHADASPQFALQVWYWHSNVCFNSFNSSSVSLALSEIVKAPHATLFYRNIQRKLFAKFYHTQTSVLVLFDGIGAQELLQHVDGLFLL
jgi:hypothetical protein